MTTAAATTAPLALAPTRRRFTVAEYYAMADAGIFSPEERVELLDGDVIPWPPYWTGTLLWWTGLLKTAFCLCRAGTGQGPESDAAERL